MARNKWPNKKIFELISLVEVAGLSEKTAATHFGVTVKAIRAQRNRYKALIENTPTSFKGLKELGI